MNAIYAPLIRKYPKAKPLAQTLVAAAAAQGASARELEIACKLAMEAYEFAMDHSGVSLTQFQSEAEAALARGGMGEEGGETL